MRKLNESAVGSVSQCGYQCTSDDFFSLSNDNIEIVFYVHFDIWFAENSIVSKAWSE